MPERERPPEQEQENKIERTEEELRTLNALRNFRGADLRGGDFSETDVTLLDLTGADITDADFRGAIMTPEQRADFKKRGAVVDDET